MTLSIFRNAVTKTPINLLDSALTLAQSIAYPNLDIDLCKAQIAAISQQIKTRQLLENGRSADRAEILAQYLYETVGLRGNLTDYEDDRNSFVNDVLERGLGIPITLSVIYIAIAQQLGLKANGVSLPGHFIVRVDGRDGEVFIDPFNGTRLSARECAQLVRQSTGYEGQFQTEWLNPTNTKSIIVRILNNLRHIYLRTNDWENVESVLDHLKIVNPHDPTYLRDEAVVSFNMGDYYDATKKLERYLELSNDQTEMDATMVNLTLGQMLAQWIRLN